MAEFGVLLKLKRDDLSSGNKNLSFDQIDYDSFKFSLYKKIVISDIVIFIDEDGKSKTIKSRY